MSERRANHLSNIFPSCSTFTFMRGVTVSSLSPRWQLCGPRGSTIVHKNITYKKHFGNYFLPRLHLQLHNKFSREIFFACASVSHGKNTSNTITQIIPQRIIFAARLQLQLHEIPLGQKRLHTSKKLVRIYLM